MVEGVEEVGEVRERYGEEVRGGGSGGSEEDE